MTREVNATVELKKVGKLRESQNSDTQGIAGTLSKSDTELDVPPTDRTSTWSTANEFGRILLHKL